MRNANKSPKNPYSTTMRKNGKVIKAVCGTESLPKVNQFL